MTAYSVSLEDIPPLLAAWSKSLDVHIPAKLHNGFFDFVRYDREEPGEVAWEYDLAYNSLKRFVFPARETLITFDRKNAAAEAVIEAPPTLLFGVHPYDLRALNQLDQLMELGTLDVNYLSRRENLVVFVMEPGQIADTAFWTSIGPDRVDLGFDLYWTRIAPSTFYVEVGTVKGEELLNILGPMPKAGVAEKEAARRERAEVRRRAAKQGLKFPWKNLPQLMNRSWNAEIWRDKSAKCLSCGSCVMVCPTCYCFEVRDEVDPTLERGVRIREWDGCMLPSFALVAGDHNFRPRALDRYRHRYFRKGKYIFDKVGEPGCVGCGRCVKACTSRIANPMAVFNELWENAQHDA